MTALLLAVGLVAVAVVAAILSRGREGRAWEREAEALLRRHEEAVKDFYLNAGRFQGTEREVLDDVEFANILRRKEALRNRLVHAAPVTGQLVTQTTLARVRQDLDLINGFRADETRREASATARTKATLILSCFEIIVAKRLRNEELGDAIEYINKPGRSRGAIYAKAAFTIFWILVNTARELMGVVWGRATK
jgi:hypothetical protein